MAELSVRPVPAQRLDKTRPVLNYQSGKGIPLQVGGGMWAEVLNGLGGRREGALKHIGWRALRGPPPPLAPMLCRGADPPPTPFRRWLPVGFPLPLLPQAFVLPTTGAVPPYKTWSFTARNVLSLETGKRMFYTGAAAALDRVRPLCGI